MPNNLDISSGDNSVVGAIVGGSPLGPAGALAGAIMGSSAKDILIKVKINEMDEIIGEMPLKEFKEIMHSKFFNKVKFEK